MAIARSSEHRILCKHGMSPLPVNQKHQPHHAIDDCMRIRVLKVYNACNQRTAIQFLNEVRQPLPFRIHVIQTDNGAVPITVSLARRNR